MGKFRLKLAAFALCVFSCFNLSSVVKASDSLVVDLNQKDDAFVLDFGELSEAGRSYTRGVKLTNSGEQSLGVTGTFVAYDNDDVENDFKRSNEWLKFIDGNSSYEIAAGGEAEAKIRLYLPQELRAGTYYSYLEYSWVNQAVAQESEVYVDTNNSVNEVKILVRFDYVDGELSRSGKLENYSSKALVFDGKLNASAKVVNMGNSGFTAKQIVRIGSAIGAANYQEVYSESKEIPAGSSVDFNYVTEEDKRGFYKVEQTISYINEDGERVEKVITQNVVSLAAFSLIVIAVVLLVLVAGIFFVKIRMNKKEEKAEKSRKKEDNEL